MSHFKSILFAGGLCLSVSAMASPPALLGQIDLHSVAYTSNNGPFEWSVAASTVSLFAVGSHVFSFCMSENNLFSPSETQTFKVYSLAGANSAEIAASGILSNNNMSGLTPTHFVEAAAQAQSFGPITGLTATDNAHNNLIHATETLGDMSFDAKDYSKVLYLQQANPKGYANAGQPQAVVTPEPASLSALALGAVALLRRRKQA